MVTKEAPPNDVNLLIEILRIGIKQVIQPYKNIRLPKVFEGNEVFQGGSYNFGDRFTITFQLAVCGHPELLALNYVEEPEGINTANKMIRKTLAERVLKHMDKPMDEITHVEDRKRQMVEAPLMPQVCVENFEGKHPNLQQYKVLVLIGENVYTSRCDGEFGMNDMHPLSKSEDGESLIAVPSNANEYPIFAMLIKGKSTAKDIDFLRSEAAKLQPLI